MDVIKGSSDASACYDCRHFRHSPPTHLQTTLPQAIPASYRPTNYAATDPAKAAGTQLSSSNYCLHSYLTELEQYRPAIFTTCN